MIHPRQLTLVLFAFFRRRFAAWATLRNRVVRIAHAQVFVLADGLQIVR